MVSFRISSPAELFIRFISANPIVFGEDLHVQYHPDCSPNLTMRESDFYVDMVQEAAEKRAKLEPLARFIARKILSCRHLAIASVEDLYPTLAADCEHAVAKWVLLIVLLAKHYHTEQLQGRLS